MFTFILMFLLFSLLNHVKYFSSLQHLCPLKNSVFWLIMRSSWHPQAPGFLGHHRYLYHGHGSPQWSWLGLSPSSCCDYCIILCLLLEIYWIFRTDTGHFALGSLGYEDYHCFMSRLREGEL